MGCSPSKGKLFSKPDCPRPQQALLAESSQNTVVIGPIEEEKTCLKTDERENGLPSPAEEAPTIDTAWTQLSPDAAADEKVEEVQEMRVNETDLILTDVVQTDTTKRTEKKKKNKVKRKSTEKQKKSSIIHAKMDFPPLMVRAHEAAYAFLNPNISKYETLLGLLDQTAQTQVSLQPMMSALVLHYEEINQALEEMADEGELMLKEHGDYMALPSGMIGPAVIPAKRSNGTANPIDPPPDLLQQLLQQSTEKMRLVGSSVQAVGDTTLEEAVEYFSSLSKLLCLKKQAKQAAERRLAQVLAWVEGAAMRKFNPEDLALHSEDSGIGGENESLTGSERQRHHRGSAGSGSCGSGVNGRGTFDSLQNNLPHQIDHNEDDGEDEEEDDDDNDDDDDEEYEDEESDRPMRRRSNSSPPDPSQPLLYIDPNYRQDLQTAFKRPLTAATATKPEEPSSTVCENSQRDLNQYLKKIAEQGNRELTTEPLYNKCRAGLRRHSLCGLAALKDPVKTYQSPCSLPKLVPQPPKRQTVRRLINTFSQGVDGRPGQSLANMPPHIRRQRKTGSLLTSETQNEGGLVINSNNNSNSWSDNKDDLDVENLPPPPPEVLMDDSFQTTDGIPGNHNGSQEHSARSLPVIHQKTGISQRLRASVQNVEVLPNRGSMTPRSVSISPSCSVRQDVVQDAEQQPQTDLDPEGEKAHCLYQQARKIIHLRNAAEFPDKRKMTEPGGRGSSSIRARLGNRCESNEFYEVEMSTCLPVTAPPVSRVRLPPSCPSVCHRFPSPPVFRPQSASRPSSRPTSPRTVTRATNNNTEEIIPSVSFREARSVFCQNDLQNSQTCIPQGSGVLSRPWGEISRGRPPTRAIDDITRRTQSEQRPSSSSHSKFSKDPNSASSQAKRSESVTTRHR